MEALDYLLNLCAAATLHGEPNLDHLGMPDDWETVHSYAERTRILPVLGWAFTSRQFAVPPQLQTTAVAKFEATRARNNAYRDLAVEIVQELQNVGVPTVVRKGAHICTMYPDIGCRAFNDLDLLIADEHLAAARRAFTRIGLEPVPLTRRQRAFLLLGTTGLPSFRESSSLQEAPRMHVDLARRIAPPILSAAAGEHSIATVIRRARRDRDRLPVLAPADLMLDLVLNLYLACVTLHYVARLRFRRLPLYLDVLITAQDLDDEDWRQFDDLITVLNLGAPMTYAFSSCLELFPNTSPGRHLKKRVNDSKGTRELQYIGNLDGIEPYHWRQSLRERIVMVKLPADIPACREPLCADDHGATRASTY